MDTLAREAILSKCFLARLSTEVDCKTRESAPLETESHKSCFFFLLKQWWKMYQVYAWLCFDKSDYTDHGVPTTSIQHFMKTCFVNLYDISSFWIENLWWQGRYEMNGCNFYLIYSISFAHNKLSVTQTVWAVTKYFRKRRFEISENVSFTICSTFRTVFSFCLDTCFGNNRPLSLKRSF